MNSHVMLTKLALSGGEIGCALFAASPYHCGLRSTMTPRRAGTEETVGVEMEPEESLEESST